MPKLAKIGMATEIESEGKASNVSITVAEVGKKTHVLTHNYDFILIQPFLFF